MEQTSRHGTDFDSSLSLHFGSPPRAWKLQFLSRSKLSMAARENQGLQAALIVFVLITIALAVTTYVYFRKAEEEGARATAARSKSSDSARICLPSEVERSITAIPTSTANPTSTTNSSVWPIRSPRKRRPV